MHRSQREAHIPEEWLGLSEAAAILGIHPSTVRSWSNLGILPVHRTQGGHRRYLRSEVELWMQSQGRAGAGEVDQMMQNALRKARYQISEGRLQGEAWYNKLDEEARQQYRASGRVLLQGLINYLTEDSHQAAAEAQAIGYEYASRGRRYDLSSVEAAHAFLYFRNVLIDSVLNDYVSAAVRSPQAWSDMFRKVNDFTDRILVSILETYEAYQRANR
jgi:excisionase family DNA binding protein